MFWLVRRRKNKATTLQSVVSATNKKTFALTFEKELRRIEVGSPQTHSSALVHLHLPARHTVVEALQ